MTVATGPEHYTDAERLLRVADTISANHDETNPAATLMLAEAQVHATLALAAAVAYVGASSGVSPASAESWHVAGAL